MNKKLTIGLALAVILALVASVAALAASAPSISSDLPDYGPGDMVTLTGAGWPAGDVVHVFVNDNVGNTWSYSFDATADANGAFTLTFQLPNWFVATYYVTASDALGGSALTTFTDGSLQFIETGLPSGTSWSVTWNGTTKSSTTNTVSFGDGVDTTATFTVTAPAGYTASPASGTATKPGSGNQKVNISFTVAKTNPTLSVTNSPVTYNGSPQAANVSGSVAGSVTNVKYNGSATVPTNAGTYAVTADFVPTDTTDYNSLTGAVAGNFVIKKATPTLSVTNSPVTYNGLPQAADVSGSVAGSVGNVQYDGSSTVPTNANTYAVTGDFTPTDSNNYNSLTGASAGNFVIGQATSTTVVTCTAGPFTYNGSAQTPCSVNVTGAGGLNLTPTPVYTNNVNAGTATASYTYAGDTNHTGSTDSKTFTIGQATSTTAVTCTAGPFTYNGSAQTPCSVSVTGVGGLNLTPTPVYANNVDAGTATASYTYAGDTNHTGSTDSKTFTIQKASSTVTVDCTVGAPFTYNGSAQTPCTAQASGVGMTAVDVTASLVYSNNTNAGTATADASWGGDSNHFGNTGTGSFTIQKASSTVTVDCTVGAPFTYNGSAQTPCTAQASGVGMTAVDVTASLVYSNNTNAGTATADASWGGDSNHFGNTGTGSFTIQKASSTTTVTFEVGPYVYRGTAFTAMAQVTGVGGLNQSVAVVYSGDCTNVTVANGCTGSATYSGDGNHYGSSDTKSITITKASSTTAVTVSDATYDGNPHGGTAVVTGAGGLSQSLTVTYSGRSNGVITTVYGPSTTAPSNPGLYTASAAFAGDANHFGSSDSKNFSILFASGGQCAGGPGHTILQPVNADGSSTWKARNTVPVKFRVCDANGVSIGGTISLVFDTSKTGGVAAPYLYQTKTGSGPLDEVAVSNTPDNQFRWDATAQQWIFNLNTNNLSGGNTYLYHIYLADGTTVDFQFALK